jgi:hypothetical protein
LYLLYPVLFIFLFCLVSNVSGQSIRPIKPFERQIICVASGIDSVCTIDSSIIEVRKVTVVTSNGIEIPVPFIYQQNSGKVLLKMKPPPGGVVRITGFSAPVKSGATYLNKQITPLNTDSQKKNDKPEISISQPQPPRTEEFTINKSGSLNRAFSFGSSKGMQLESGLNMQLQGEIGNNYKIKASLTDQNVPIQPEGNTRTLQEIDRVYIDVTGPGLSVRFGDLYLDKKNTQFANYSRKLSGADVKSAVKGNGISTSYASAQGTYNSVRMMGKEGNQGPYLLTGKNGERSIIVVAGTERVYIDGQLMTRGEEYDYIIDYAAASVMFTRRRLITGDSRIVVDFQYSDENYKKNFYTVTVGNDKTSSGFNYSAAITRESDNTARPINGTLADSDERKIAGAGDNRLDSYKSGAEYVGTGNGTYKRVVNGSTEYFVYADSADYKVIFSDVGEGQGDYIFRRLGVYEYAGEKKGRYMPYVILPIPQSHSVSDISFGYVSPNNGMRLSGEFAYSNLDRNTLSNKDDNDNTGGAFLLEFTANPAQVFPQGKNFGIASFSAKAMRTDSRFHPLDRAVDVEFGRKWNLEKNDISGEQSVEIETKLTPISFLSITPSYGFLTLPNGFHSARSAGTIQLRNTSNLSAHYFIESISSTESGIAQNWNRQKGAISYTAWNITPSVSYERESKKDEANISNGFVFNDWAGKLDYSLREKLTAYILYQTRSDRTYQNNILKPFSRSENITLHSDIAYGQRLFSQIHLVNRNRTYSTTGNRVETRLADVRIQSSEFNGGLTMQLNADLSREQMPEKELVYFHVENGHGNYALDSHTGEYFTDNNGNYELRTFTTDNLHGINRQTIGLNVSMEPAKWTKSGSEKSLLQSLRSISIFRYDNGKNASGVDRGGSLFKSLLITQDVYAFEKSDKYSLRLRQSYNYLNNFLYTAQSEERKTNEYSLRLQVYPNTAITIESIGTFKLLNKTIGGVFPIIRSMSSIKTEYTISLRPQTDVRYTIALIAARERDEENELPQIYYYGCSPGFEKAFLGSGRIMGNFRWLKVNSPAGVYLPYEFAEGNQLGNNYFWNLSFDYRTAQNLITTIRYIGDRTTRYGKTIHNFRAEMQVLF